MMIEKLGAIEPLKNLRNAQRVKQVEELDTADSINLSPEAQRMSEVYLAMETAKAAPDIREEKIAEVMKKFEDPNYMDSVLDLTADKIIDSIDI